MGGGVNVIEMRLARAFTVASNDKLNNVNKLFNLSISSLYVY